jgi:pimeloyl-ACP methyl ester carboxylesterase/DNA-binding CsgD family transcriptional regulator
LEFDARSPVWTHWLRELSRDNTYIRYDQRGCGLSDQWTSDCSFEAWVSDLEAVVEHLGLKRFALFGMSQGGAIAIAYAARHPERVSRLVLFGAYGRGILKRDISPQQRHEAEALITLIRTGWGRDNPAFRQVFTTLFIPDGTPEQHQWFNDLERVSASPENAAGIVETSYRIDVTALAERVRAPTLVFHSRNDARVPFDEGRQLAALIPDARFISLESRNHVLLETESAWPYFLNELRGFLFPESKDTGQSGLTGSERKVMELLARGFDNRSIAARLGRSEKTVRNQLSSIYSKMGVRTRAQAIVRARDSSDL